MRELKAVSSGWVHNETGMRGFAWQEGYGAFTMSKSNVDSVTNYIQEQREHHQHRTFQEKYLDFLRKHQVEYDERYVWG